MQKIEQFEKDCAGEVAQSSDSETIQSGLLILAVLLAFNSAHVTSLPSHSLFIVKNGNNIHLNESKSS